MLTPFQASSMKQSVKSTFLLMLSMSRFFGRSGHWKRCWIQQAKYVNTETGSEDPDLAGERAPGIWAMARLWRTKEPCVSQLVHSWGDICNLSSCTLSKVSTVSYSYLRKFPFLLWAEAPDFYTWLVPALSLSQAMLWKQTAEDTGGTAFEGVL